MIVDGTFLQGATQPPVLIIGSGPAGTSLALRLAQHGTGALVLEAGPEEYSDDSQDFYTGEIFGDGYYDLDATRLRYFGGSSNHWEGWCRPLDARDFERREDVPHTGWPIGKADLDPFLEDAAGILEVAPPGEHALSDDLLEVGFSQSPPVRFGEKYRSFYADSPDTHLILSCCVESLEASEGRISALNLVAGGERLRIPAPPVVVLCCGGIENSRLLLWSNARSLQRIVAQDGSLGRYWMEHPHAVLGEVRISRNFDRLRLDNDEVRVAPTREAMMRYGIMNGALRFRPTFTGGGMQEWVKRTGCVTGPLGERMLDLAGASNACSSRVSMAWEQAPVPENRIALSEQARDAYGVPRPELHWSKTAIDYRTARVILEIFGRYLVEEDRGRIRASPFVIAEKDYPTSRGGHHHMGGTRMSATASEGVVDANLRIHGLSNGYVLGSSVFPTGGHANPTMTIVQLALRLGDHLPAQI